MEIILSHSSLQKNKTRTIGMPFVWTIDCHSTLFLYYVSNAEITSHKEETRAE
nr:hypothetical protein [Bacillus thuringiensis]